MKKLAGFMIIITLPMLCVVHLLALMACLPFIAIYSAIHQTVKCIKELFDMRNTLQFVKGTLNQAWKLINPKDTK
jgi:hypothetical protein